MLTSWRSSLCLFVSLFRSEKQPAYHVRRLLVSLACLGRSHLLRFVPALTEEQRRISPDLLYVKGRNINARSTCIVLNFE